MAVAELDFAQDVLSGLNVRPKNYLDLDQEAAEAAALWAEWDDEIDRHVHVPFAVYRYYSGEGTNDYPENVFHSGHRTRKGAETEVTWLEYHGVNPAHLSIEEGVWEDGWRVEHHMSDD